MASGAQPIAIVGIGGVLPAAPNPELFWANILNKVDASREVPEGRWRISPSFAFDPRVGRLDKVYSTRGCFLDPLPPLDCSPLSIDPHLLDDLDPLFLLALHAGAQAFNNAITGNLNRSRVGVIMANIVLPTVGATEWSDEVFGRILEEKLFGNREKNGFAHPVNLVNPVQSVHPLNRFSSGLPAALLAQSLSLGGTCYTLDAACASSLYALKVACDELREGRADAMLAGGVSRPDCLFTQMGFSQLRALSPSGHSYPFDSRADGLVVGEGGAMFLLKRLGDALRDGDHVHALIRGVGLSNDRGGSLLAPDSEGQLRAMRDAYRQAEWNPSAVDLIECHATGTPIGDATEFHSLRALWKEEKFSAGQCAIGSAKSNVGHLLTAAGAAGLLKVLFALRERTLPPSANFERTSDKINFEGSPFRIQTQAESWSIRDEASPRRAAVSAFGFGGINAHLLVEEWNPDAIPNGKTQIGFSGGKGSSETTDIPHSGVVIVGMEIYSADSQSPREFAVSLDRFRIPPNEFNEMLPQQALMLEVVSRAVDDADGLVEEKLKRTGVFIGIGLDMNTANYDLRWTMADKVRRWNDERGLGLSVAEQRSWIESLLDSVGPPLTANRTIGGLGGMVASRIARELRVGGPSFTLSSEDTSGLHALEIACRALQRGELDQAVVGAVELGSDIRSGRANDLARENISSQKIVPSDSAVALVLKPLEAAQRDGNQIYGIIREVETSNEGMDRSKGATNGSSGGNQNGHSGENPIGAADGLVAVTKIFRSIHSEETYGKEPRRIEVNCKSIGGNRARVVVETFESNPFPRKSERPSREGRSLRISVGHEIGILPAPIRDAGVPPVNITRSDHGRDVHAAREPRLTPPSPPVAATLVATRQSVAEAQESFLRFSESAIQTQMNVLEFQQSLMARLGGEMVPAKQIAPTRRMAEPDAAFSRDQCLEFARGSIGKVLGGRFASVDRHPTRVRLPDEPLMFVDRIVSVEGKIGEIGPGRIVTEHDVLPGAWYLNADRIPTGFAIEAGQADLFLSAYLGMDFKTLGRAKYRLLDAAVTFHGGLPRPGQTIRYDIRIERFIKQGDTHLFFFHFDGSVDGVPVLSMRNGCAGFFTDAQLRDGKGVILSEQERRTSKGKRPGNWREFVPVAPASYDEKALNALREGDLVGCFGPQFETLNLARPLTIPGGKMKLIDRVTDLNPHGGRYGLGMIRAESDIHPDDWFLTCHFADDPVMPGTLMYESCLHALRVYLMRLGWIGGEEECAFEPVPGVRSKMRCRGQVIPSTKKATYEIHLKELGYGPEPFALADAMMFADGHPIVWISDMSLKLSGMTKERLEQIWSEVGRDSSSDVGSGEPIYNPRLDRNGNAKPAIFNRDKLVAFARGKPSEAYGEPYTIFDQGRFIARLPSPPYLFLDRVTEICAEAWNVKNGASVETQYDVRPDDWYFRANRQSAMPFSVVLEVALQSCGWLAAYMGSALRSKEELHFRNLGGNAILREDLMRDAGMLTTRAKLINASQSGDMMIQEYEFALSRGSRVIYEGTTSFGFFTRATMAQQIGLRAANPYVPTPDEIARGRRIELPEFAPLTPDDPNFDSGEGLALPAKAYRMLDWIELYIPDGGPNSLGFIRGVKGVDPDEWFFTAHFYQDPVCPGSLGLEAFLQLLKTVALERWGDSLARTHRFTSVAPSVRHSWSYRGQIIPTNKRVEVEAVITSISDDALRIQADGFLRVDDLAIYEIKNFAVQLEPTSENLK